MRLDEEDEELNQTVSEILSGMMSNENKSATYSPAPNGFIDQRVVQGTSERKPATI